MFISFFLFLLAFYIFLRACVAEIKPETFILIQHGFQKTTDDRAAEIVHSALKALNLRIVDTI